MEVKAVRPGIPTLRSKRDSAKVRSADLTCTDKIKVELNVEREESSDDFEERSRKTKRTKVSAKDAPDPARKSNLNLIEVIKSDGKEIPHVAKLWVELYERDQNSAMAELLPMLVEACGAKYKIQEEDVDKGDFDEVFDALDECYEYGEVKEYRSSRGFENFKDNLLSFWDNLVRQCPNGPLFDQLLDKCFTYIFTLSSTPCRVYRQMTSLIGFQLMSSFIHVAKNIGTQRETTQSQLTAEKRKNSEGPQVQSLTKSLERTGAEITRMEEKMQEIFDGLFKHRYRDACQYIRKSCIESLVVWVLLYPSKFLQGPYLKYLGLMLNDKNAGVRKASVLSLQKLYEKDDYVQSLTVFTKFYCKRMVELADDIDISVAVCAIGLVKQLSRHRLVPEEELGSLYVLLIGDSPEVRNAIGSLVHDHMIAQKIYDSESRSTGNDSDSPEVHISRLLKILNDAEPILRAYVIDNIWDHMGAMKNWECITGMLLHDKPSAILNDVDTTNLIWLLLASVKKAVGEKIVPATDIRNPHETEAQTDMFEKEKHKITVSMMNTYPLLVKKFVHDKDKAAPLLEIAVHMNLELYSPKSQEQNFKSIVQPVREAFFRHDNEVAFRSCVTAIEFCASHSQGELKDFVQNQVKELQEELLAQLNTALKGRATGGDDDVLLNLKKLYELQLQRNVPLDSLYQNLVDGQNCGDKDEEVIAFILLNLHLHVSWSLFVATSKPYCQTSICTLLDKRDNLLVLLEHILGNDRHGYQLKYRVCVILSDIWCLFKKTKFDSTDLKCLGYFPSKFNVEKYWDMCKPLLHISEYAEDKDGKIEYVKETIADDVMFALCKLVVNDVVPKELFAPEIISHLDTYSPSARKIVKRLVTALQEKGDISCLLLEALKRAYQRYLSVSSDSKESLSTKSLQKCKNLASRLSRSYLRTARDKYTSQILNIVEEGINHAFGNAPKQLSFLHVLLHFISKLPEPDKYDIMAKVQIKFDEVYQAEVPDGWAPFYTFVEVFPYNGEGVKDVKEGTSVKRRGRPRKKLTLPRKRLFDDQNSSDGEYSVNGSDQDSGNDEEKKEKARLKQLIFRASAKLRNLRVSKEEEKKAGDSSRATDEVATPKTSGDSC